MDYLFRILNYLAVSASGTTAITHSLLQSIFNMQTMPRNVSGLVFFYVLYICEWFDHDVLGEHWKSGYVLLRLKPTIKLWVNDNDNSWKIRRNVTGALNSSPGRVARHESPPPRLAPARGRHRDLMAADSNNPQNIWLPRARHSQFRQASITVLFYFIFSYFVYAHDLNGWNFGNCALQFTFRSYSYQ